MRGKIVSCSKCFANTEIKRTVIIEGRRICLDCKAKQAKENRAWSVK